MEPISIPLLLQESAKITADFPSLIAQMTKDNNRLLSIPENLDVQTALLKKSYISPPLGIGAAVYHNKSSKDSVFALFNGAAYHSPPSTLLMISNAVLNKGPGNLLIGYYGYNYHFFRHNQTNHGIIRRNSGRRCIGSNCRI